MLTPTAKAIAYLEKLEADRQAAIAMSEQKAEDAKLIAARQEAFQAAMDIFAGASSVSSGELQSDKSGRRRSRRDIAQLILRELSFSGRAMTTTQIAKAIDYTREGTEAAVKRLESVGKVSQDEDSRWAIVPAALASRNGHAVAANGESSPYFPEC
jgi:hypothetical protein